MHATLQDQHEQEWGVEAKPPLWVSALEFFLAAFVVGGGLALITWL